MSLYVPFLPIALKSKQAHSGAGAGTVRVRSSWTLLCVQGLPSVNLSSIYGDSPHFMEETERLSNMSKVTMPLNEDST